MKLRGFTDGMPSEIVRITAISYLRCPCRHVLQINGQYSGVQTAAWIDCQTCGLQLESDDESMAPALLLSALKPAESLENERQSE